MPSYDAADADRETLSGGVHEVLRIGDAVRRPTGPWSPQVHDLLRALTRSGFTGSPRVRAVIADGFEILDFLPGHVSPYPMSPQARTQLALESAARLLREYHDHTIDFAATAACDGWMLPTVDPVEVICHSDYGPHNVVLRGTRAAGIIDFDTAHPGPRVWDVAYGVYRWAPANSPQHPEGFGTAEQQATRTRIFCDHYGLSTEGRTALIDTIIARLNALVEFMKSQAARGHSAFERHLTDGHHIQYLQDAAYVAEHRETFERRLLG